MKKAALIIFSLAITIVSYSQDYKVNKIKTENKGDFKTTRLLMLTDSVAEIDINEFIVEFATTLKTEFEKNNVQFIYLRRGCIDDEQLRSTLNDFKPDATIEFMPTRLFVRYRGFSQKNGLEFRLNMSFTSSENKDLILAFTTKIEVMVDSFENAGVPAALKIFDYIEKAGYLSKEELKSN